MKFENYSCSTIESMETEFRTCKRYGLKDPQIIENQKKYGDNIVIKSDKNWLEILLLQYESPFIILLIFAAYMSLFLNEYINAITIFAVVLINTVISFYQEYFATKEVSLLEKYLERISRVVRNGKEILIESGKIVPGDLVILEPGDNIPADLRIIESSNLSINESVLSGESLPVKKVADVAKSCPQNIFCANNIGFNGTVVVAGKGKGIVFAVGHQTEFGLVSDLSCATVNDTKFFKNLRKISYFLIKIILATLICLVFLHILFKGQGVNISQLFMFAVALAVGLAPEALPSISNLALSRGAVLLAKNKVIVKRLSSIEDFGGLEIICTDKTGTITENILKIEDVNSPFYTYKDAIRYMALSSSRTLESIERPLHPFDAAVWDKLIHDDFEYLSNFRRVTEIPFDSAHRRTLVLVQNGEDLILLNNGDFQEVADRSTLSIDQKTLLRKWIEEKAKLGCRVIAVSKRVVGPLETGNLQVSDLSSYENNMEFVAVIALFDPIRPTVKYSMDQARKLGLQVKIITGDDAPIASNIAHQIGLIRNVQDVVTGQEFAQMSESEKERIAIVVPVFARFLPEQKYELIKILKKTKSVGYLGDGINDAPAIKEADVGFAVSGAVDIAKDAADIILLKKSLVTMVDGIKIGRTVFVNTFSYLKITLASNLGNFFSMAIISLFIPFLPLLPLQILLVNFLSDAPMIAISTDNVNPLDLAKPTSYNLKNLAIFISIFGVISSFFDFIFFYKFYKFNSPAFLQTNWFIFSIFTEVAFIFSGRTKMFFARAVRPSYWIMIFSFLTIVLTVFIPFSKFGQNIFLFSKPTGPGIFIIFGITAGYFFACEVFKLFYYKFIVPLDIKNGA